MSTNSYQEEEIILREHTKVSKDIEACGMACVLCVMWMYYFLDNKTITITVIAQLIFLLIFLVLPMGVGISFWLYFCVNPSKTILLTQTRVIVISEGETHEFFLDKIEEVYTTNEFDFVIDLKRKERYVYRFDEKKILLFNILVKEINTRIEDTPDASSAGGWAVDQHGVWKKLEPLDLSEWNNTER